MPSVVVDSVLVEAGWDPTALERGLALSERLVRDFVASHPQVTVGVDGREIDGLNAKIKAIGKTPIVLPPIVVPPVTLPPAAIVPPIVVPPPDFTQIIAEATQAAAIVREEFEDALRPASTRMSMDAFDAGIVAGKQLQAGLLAEIQGIGNEVASGVISIPAATAKVDAAIQAVSQEFQKLAGAIPPIQIRTVVMPQGAHGVTTGTSPGVISASEINESTEAFDRLNGTAQVTNQQFVKLGAGSSKVQVGLRTVGSTLSSVAAGAIGADTQIGRLAEQLLFVAGAGVALAGAAAFAVVALAYERLSAGARLARDEQDKLAQSLSSSVSSGPQDTGLAVQQLQSGQIRNLTVIETLERGIAAARGRQRDLQQEINTGLPVEVAGWAAVLGAAGRVLGIQAALLDPITRILEKLRLERDVRLGIIALAAEEAKESNAIAAGRQAQVASSVAFASSLASGLQSQVKIADASRLTAAHAAELRKLIAGGTQDYALQVAAVTALNALERGRIAALEQQSATQQQAASQSAQLFQELSSQQDALLAPITIDIDVSEALANLNRLQGPLQKTADALRDRAQPLLASAVTADLGRQLVQEANLIDASNRRIDQNNITFEARRLARLEASAAAGLRAIQQAAQAQPTILLPVQLDVDAAVAQLEEARQTIADRIGQFTSAGQAVPPQLLAELTERERQIQEAIELPARVLLDSTGALGDRLASLTAIAENARQLATQGVDRPETVTEIAERERALLPILATLQTRYDAITAAIVDQATPQSQINDLLREQGNILGQLAAHRVPTPIEVTQLGPIEEAVQRYADAKQKFEAATAQRLPAEAKAAATEMDAAGKALDAAAQATVRAILALKLDATTTQRILDAIAAAYGRIGRSSHQASEGALRLASAFDKITQVVDGIRAVGDQLGVLDERSAKALKGVADLSEGISKIAKGDVLGGIIEGVQGAIGVVQGVFGKSADQKAAEAALHENTAALRDAAVKFSQGFQGAGGAADAENILRQVIASAAGQANISQTQEGGDTGRAARNALVDQLASAGLGFKDLQRLAKEFGITILERGKLVGDALEQLTEAMRLAAEAATKFGTTTSERQRVLETRDALGLGPNAGLPPDVAALSRTREVELGGLVLDPATEARIAALDLQTEAGRQAFLAFQRMLFQLAQSGQLTAEQLGTFDSVTELLGPINDAANGINAMTDAAKNAAKNLGDLNLPQGFRRAAIAFQTGDTGPDPAQLVARTAAVTAQFFPTAAPIIKPLPDDAQALLDRIAKQAPSDLLAAVNRVGDLIAAGQQSATPTGDTTAASPAALFGAAPRDTRTTITFEGDLHFHISGEQRDPERIASDVYAALRRKALVQSGDSLQQFGIR